MALEGRREHGVLLFCPPAGASMYLSEMEAALPQYDVMRVVKAKRFGYVEWTGSTETYEGEVHGAKGNINPRDKAHWKSKGGRYKENP